MIKNDERLCITGKHIYESEAAATRALNKYSDIKRIYKCPQCTTLEGQFGWHTSSMSYQEVKNSGIEPWGRKKFKITKEKIKKRMQELKRKIFTPKQFTVLYWIRRQDEKVDEYIDVVAINEKEALQIAEQLAPVGARKFSVV